MLQYQSKRRAPSLFWRAVLALLLMVGFYVMALGLAALLLYIPYAELRYAHQLHLQILLPCGVAAFLILRSVLPRFDRFQPPGLLLSADEQPQLFAVIRELASATEQPLPKDVFLVSDMNAFVTQRGGLMGFGSHRVLGIGLPILQALSVSELRAVLAHEFGHFHGGDVQLGPWIYKTRAAIIRTVISLAQERSIFHKPFVWYGEMFIKVTHAISRRQELAADALAARTVGAQPLISGLKRTHAAALAYNVYWQEDMLPALGSGWRPPLAAGFARFLGAKRAQRAMDESVAQELDQGKADPYDTHPSLRERVEALDGVPSPTAHGSSDERPAIALLADLAAIEKLLVDHMVADKTEAARLKPIAWTDVPTNIYLPNWRTMVGGEAEQLAGHTLLALPTTRGFRMELGRSVAGEHAAQCPDDTLLFLGATRIAAAVVLGLVELDYALDCAPGEAVTLSKDGASVQPFAILLDTQKADRAIDELRAACAAAGVADLDLGAIAERARAAAPGEAQ